MSPKGRNRMFLEGAVIGWILHAIPVCENQPITITMHNQLSGLIRELAPGEKTLPAFRRLADASEDVSGLAMRLLKRPHVGSKSVVEAFKLIGYHIRSTGGSSWAVLSKKESDWF
jgi:hypothetical protein